jgi:hypothetical protein
MLKKVVALVLLIALALAASSYFSPYFTIYAMKQAVDRRDAQALSEYIDFPALRANIDAQLQAKVRRQLSTPETRGNPLANLGAGIVSNLGRPKIDAMISPAGLIVLLKRGELKAGSDAADAPEAPAAPPDTPLAPAPPAAAPERAKDSSARLADARRAHYWIRYTDMQTVVASSQAKHISFTFKRTGIWSWRLVDARLPASALE